MKLDHQVLVLYRIQANYKSENIQKSGFVYLLYDDLIDFDTKIKDIIKHDVSTHKNSEKRRNSNSIREISLPSNLPSLPDLETIMTIESNSQTLRRGSLAGGFASTSSKDQKISSNTSDKVNILDQGDGQLELAEKELLLQGYLNNILTLVYNNETSHLQNEAILKVIGETFQL